MKQKKYFLTVLPFFLFTLLYSSLLLAGTVTLSWKPPAVNANGTELTDLAGYYLYVGLGPRDYYTTIDVGNETVYQVDNLTEGDTFYFAVAAYDTSGNKSVYSDEIIKTIESSSEQFSSESVSNQGATAVFSDDFSTDTIGEYALVHIWKKRSTGQFLYDAAAQRAQVLTDDNVGLQFSHVLAPSDEGIFSIDFVPYTKYPAGGRIYIRLVEDQGNYYEIANTDGYGPGYIRKVVNGVVVDSAVFRNGYYQNSNYQITFSFSPDHATLEAFGETLSLNTYGFIMVYDVEVELQQQDAYFDNIVYTID